MSNILKYQNPSSPLLIQRVNQSKANFVKRLLDPNRKSIPDWETKGQKIATHKMSWGEDEYGAYVFPEIQEIDGQLIDFSRPPYAPGMADYMAHKNNNIIRMSSEEADWFTRNYKQYYPSFKKGGDIHIKKENRGKFGASAKRAGMGTQEYARHVLANKDDYSSIQVKRAAFAKGIGGSQIKRKHKNGGILKVQEGTGNNFWYKLWNAVKEGGMAARDAKLGAVGAQQVRDLYSEGKNQEAQDLAKQYAKANTTGISLTGGAASTGLLGDLMVTGTTTAADTFIDGDTENFGKNLVKNVAGDLIGHGIFKGLKYFNGKPIFVKDMKNGIGKGLYHIDYGDGKGAFNSGVYTKNGYLHPGKTSSEGQLDYIWFNESKPYTTALYDKPFSRTIIFDQNDVPGILRVRDQKYPIGQWTGKSGFVTKHEMVTSNPVNMNNATIYKRIPVFDIWLRTK